MATIELFFDLSSPYSYLAATQIEAVARRAQAKTRWAPMVLGAVFQSAGSAMPMSVPAKAQWMMSDLARWADYYKVPFTMPAVFPLNAMTTHRAILVAARDAGEAQGKALALAAYNALWGEGRDVSQAEVISDLASELGLDGDAIVAATQDADIKAQLRQNTEEAVARGAFGAPTIFVGESMFWGNDRLHFVEAAAAQAASR